MGINLVKGQKIDLTKKDGNKLKNICVGCNWGAIEKKGFFGGMKKEAVDLDASCAIFDEKKNLLDVVYFGALASKDGAVKHSGDDTTGDLEGDDGLDNEVLMVDLDRVSPQAHSLVFVLNSFKGQDFATIPFASVRIYEGTPSRVDSEFATFNIASDPQFGGKVSMILGKLYRRNGEWKFASIGDATDDRKLEETIQSVAERHL